jgi:circadian clock protein KaiC
LAICVPPIVFQPDPRQAAQELLNQHQAARSAFSNVVNENYKLGKEWPSMAVTEDRVGRDLPVLEKAPTGIQGLDEITAGGLPRGRTTLVCGSAGCGKTLFSLEFLVRGAVQYDEPGVFMSFEETSEEVAENVASLGFDLNQLSEQGKLALDHVHVERSEIEETGEYDLQGLFIRLGYAIDSIGAKRVVLDTLEALFGGLSNEAILRAELRRLFRWLKNRGVTAIITGERVQEGTLTRHGLEEYVSDCVILLEHRVTEQVSTRKLRIVKYRGSVHGTNEYPFLISETGISVLPITSLGLDYDAWDERISTGVAALDEMLEGKGYYRGSTILLSGTAGTGKSSLSAHFANATCKAGERCLYFAFEESPNQIIRNMRSIGIDLKQWTQKGLLQFQAARPTVYGMEMHLLVMHRLVSEFNPTAVIVDPVTNFITVSNTVEVKAMLMRLIDYLKMQGITALFTSLTANVEFLEQTDVGISSLIDSWIMLRDIESNGERNRGLYVLKSRGMAHSNQIREYLLTRDGIQLLEPYLGPSGVLTGSARVSQEAQDEAVKTARYEAVEGRRLSMERKRKALEAQIAAMRAEFEAEEEEANSLILQDEKRENQIAKNRRTLARSRRVTGPRNTGNGLEGGD